VWLLFFVSCVLQQSVTNWNCPQGIRVLVNKIGPKTPAALQGDCHGVQNFNFLTPMAGPFMSCNYLVTIGVNYCVEQMSPFSLMEDLVVNEPIIIQNMWSWPHGLVVYRAVVILIRLQLCYFVYVFVKVLNWFQLLSTSSVS
jgi:hypothetical protein